MVAVGSLKTSGSIVAYFVEDDGAGGATPLAKKRGLWPWVAAARQQQPLLPQFLPTTTRPARVVVAAFIQHSGNSSIAGVDNAILHTPRYAQEPHDEAQDIQKGN